jgi:signal transduction histidine kinase
MVPMLDADDNVVRYFGMCRNVTDMVETEQRLAVESKKAQETELLKQAFLTNMSYEIRTPLNSVVGFAELFNSEHDEADEPLFVEEIKRSTNTLLLLVNDVLFLSRLDARMEEYKKEETDFALAFESMCQIGLITVKPGVKTVVAHPYNSLVVDIDAEHVGQIIQRLCALSCSQTEQGTITASYGYRRGELTISIEDTGRGIDSELLSHAFERFSRDRQGNMCGTGLDLPIVRLMAQQMGGNVDIQSDLGKGTTIWVSIPCSCTVMEKQRETVS